MRKTQGSIRVEKDSDNLYIIYTQKNVRLGYAIKDVEEWFFHFAQGVVGQGGAWSGSHLKDIGLFIEKRNKELEKLPPIDEEEETPEE